MIYIALPTHSAYNSSVLVETLAKQPQNFRQNQDYSYLNARSRYFKNVVRRAYSIFLRNQFIFRFSKERSIINEATQNLEKFSQDVIKVAKTRKEDGGLKNSKQRVIDLILSTDGRDEVLAHQLNAFIAAVSKYVQICM